MSKCPRDGYGAGLLSVIIIFRKSTLVMNLKETIISSFFFHLSLFLLMIMVSNYTTGLPGGIQKIIPVDLAMEDKKDQPAARSDAADEQLPDSSQPSDEESMKIPESEEKAESTAEPTKIEKVEKPSIQREGFTSLEAYHQYIILHKKIFRQQVGARVNELLGEALKVNKREFYGGTAIVSLMFGPDGTLNEVLVESASPALKAFFEEIDWGGVPAPAAYSLGSAGVQIEFTVLEGYMSFNIKAR